jgi:predicted PurR-regulated permease PerM
MLFKRKSDSSAVEITVNVRTLIKVFLFAIGAFLFVLALRKAEHALLLVFTAFFLALALNAPVSWIARHLPGKSRGSRAVATSISALMVIVVLGAFVASLIPPIVRQTQSLIDSAPKIVRDVRSDNSDIGRLVKKYHLEKQVNNVSNELGDRLKNISGSAVSTATRIGSSVFSVLTILVLTFMMLVEGPRWVAFMRELVPDHKENHVMQVVNDMYRVVKGYVNGQVLLAAIATAMLLPGLLIFHVSYPVALLGVVFICGLIPMVGHSIGAVIVTIVALFHSPYSALGILIYYITYQQIENYVIQPRLQANSTDMSPLLVFSAVVIGVSFSGLFGGLVAIPIAGCIRVWVLDYLRTRNLIGAPVVKEEIKNATT